MITPDGEEFRATDRVNVRGCEVAIKAAENVAVNSAVKVAMKVAVNVAMNVGMKAVVALTVAVLVSTPAHAQSTQPATSSSSSSPSRFTGTRISTGLAFERASFSGGLLDTDLAGLDSSRVNSATALSVPLQFNTILDGVWLIDAGTSFTNGKREVEGSPAGGDESLSGLGDLRLRVSRRFDGMGLRFTFGANIPTGKTSLDNAQASTLSVLASPAVGLTQPAVGFGAGATLGAVKSFASASRLWGVAVGTSVEWRGSYEPFAALAAGASVNDYDPGEVFRISAGASRLFGESKGLVTASLDLFSADKVSAAGAVLPTQVKIGPTFSIDGQWLPATTRVQNATLYGALRLRSALKRDGVELPNSGNVVFEAGARGARSLTSSVSATFDVSGRVLTGVEIDNRIATAASSSVAPSVGLAFVGASWTLQPAVTARFGTIDTGVESSGFTVIGARLLLERRF